MIASPSLAQCPLSQTPCCIIAALIIMHHSSSSSASAAATDLSLDVAGRVRGLQTLCVSVQQTCGTALSRQLRTPPAQTPGSTCPTPGQHPRSHASRVAQHQPPTGWTEAAAMSRASALSGLRAACDPEWTRRGADLRASAASTAPSAPRPPPPPAGSAARASLPPPSPLDSSA
eukprot:3389026-Rhodomonas_salina.2